MEPTDGRSERNANTPIANNVSKWKVKTKWKIICNSQANRSWWDTKQKSMERNRLYVRLCGRRISDSSSVWVDNSTVLLVVEITTRTDNNSNTFRVYDGETLTFGLTVRYRGMHFDFESRFDPLKIVWLSWKFRIAQSSIGPKRKIKRFHVFWRHLDFV